MDCALTDKLAVVTASSEGLGFACAESLIKEGVHVIICSRSQEKLDKATQKLSGLEGKVTAYQCDLLDQSSIEGFIRTVENNHRAPDIVLISTHHPPTMPFSRANLEDWQRGHDLTIRPVILFGKAWLSKMQEKKFGRLIVIGSIFGKEHEESSVIQSTYRAGLIGLIKCIAREYAIDGISANIINPGYFDTPLVRNLAPQYARQDDRDVQDVLDEWRTSSPAGRFGRPDEIGSLAVYLASANSGFVNGEVITIDGAKARST